MNETSPATPLPDGADRERAATTFDRNVVVTAGAGTGKTRLLVDRLVHLLMRDPDLKLTQVVALTFTNKAANEIKLRLRERLEGYLAARLEEEPANSKDKEIQTEIRALMERYRLSKERLERRSLDALRQIERSEIGTIHGFAATLLRLYPIEAGVDPQFVEDDGARFERLFNERWGLWLDQELSRRGARQEEWRNALRKIGLGEIKELAASLCSETVDLARLGAPAREMDTPPKVLEWLKSIESRAAALVERHSEDRGNEKLIRAARGIVQRFLSGGDLGGAGESLARSINKNLKGWTDADVEEAREIRRVALALCQVDEPLSRGLCELLIPFAENFREALAREGLVSFDGLLARARGLVRDHPTVREELKRRFTAILIDEFQDTDPIQYEILVYLAEEIGRHAAHWREVKLVPGKIFVVGDPKQSIYAFRRADIEAYLEVVEKIIKAQDGIECRLTANFRSHAGILDVVNGVFGRLIEARPGLQPPYVAIEPAPSGGAEPSLPFRRVTLCKVQGGEDEKLNAESARRLEAENLARWLDEEVLGKAEIVDQAGNRAIAEPRDVAILLRRLTDVHHYLEPLRRRGLSYVVEGERHFYAVQEVIDAVNLLRAVENPHDKLALLGVLRSPLGGFTDAEIYELGRRRLLDYRAENFPEEAAKKSFAPAQELYALLRKLHGETRPLPVAEAVARIFDGAPVRLLAAASFHGEQAVANLEKLRRQAELMAREGLCTFKEVIARLEARVLEIKDESESALAEENLDAIRILSIHKSKGLEFPIVVLAGCNGAPNHGGERAPEALNDWSTDLAGLRAGSFSSLAGLYIAERARQREAEEQKRVLYVAMTRAREHLRISAAPTDRASPGSYLSMLEEVLGEDLAGAQASRAIRAGAGSIELTVIRETLSPPGRSRPLPKEKTAPFDWDSYAALWRRRSETCRAAADQPLFLSPTLLKRREAELAERFSGADGLATPSELPLLVGELAHRFLESWNFDGDPAGFRARLEPFLDRWVEPGQEPNRDRLRGELEEIFDTFFTSEAYRELKASNILGREVPLLMPWNGQIMEGVIDLVYEKDGQLFLADYKSDRVQPAEIPATAARYHHQVEIYSEAVRRALKREPAGFKLIFLRLGQAISV